MKQKKRFLKVINKIEKSLAGWLWKKKQRKHKLPISEMREITWLQVL